MMVNNEKMFVNQTKIKTKLLINNELHFKSTHRFFMFILFDRCFFIFLKVPLYIVTFGI